MGLLQKAVETYDAHAAQVGEVQVGHEVLAPVSHILTSAQIEITVNAAGELADARAVDKKESKIIIPVGGFRRPHQRPLRASPVRPAVLSGPL